MKDLYILLLFGLVARVDAGDYFVIGPNCFRFKHDETVLISMFGPETNYQVTVWLEHNGAHISEKQVTVPNKRSPKVVTMRVDEKDIFDDDTIDKPRTIKLVSSNNGVRREIDVLLSYDTGFLIVQTDKPIYTPLQEVRVRTLAMDESLKAAKAWNCSMDIISPSNLTIGRATRTKNEVNGFFTHMFTLPPNPEIGIWTILARFKGQLETRARALFEVKEYVLPTFGVTVGVEQPYILKTTKEIHVNVEAKYVYGKSVRGSVGLELFLLDKDDGSKKNVLSMKRKQLSFADGTKQFIVNVKDIIESQLRDDHSFPAGSYLEVVADVFESATGNEENASNERTVFAIEPYTFKFTRSKNTFRPGWAFYLKVDVFLANGAPAANKDITMKLVKNNENDVKQTKTDRNGQALETFSTSNDGNAIEFEVICESTSSKRHIAKPYKGKSQIQVETVIKDGNLEARAFTNIKKSSGLLFVIVTRGKIVYYKYVKATNQASEVINEHLKERLTPSGRLIVFYVEDGKVVADSVKFDVEAKCRGEGLTLSSEKDKLRPGENDRLTITGTPLMHVGLNVIDQALLLLNRENVLRKSKMFKILEKHDLGCGEGSGESVEEVFKNAGLTVLSNVNMDTGKLTRNTKACEEKRRRKRSVGCNGANEWCCEKGYAYGEELLYEHGLDVDEMQFCYAMARLYLDSGKYRVVCSIAFYRECIQVIQKERYDYGPSSRSDSDESDYETDLQHLKGMDIKVRSDFRESWLFEEIQLDDNGHASKELPFPDSITTWMIQAIGITANKGICIAEPRNVTSYRDFFIQLELPYKAVRLEHIAVKATIFNYGNPGDKEKKVSIYLEGRKELCSNIQPGKQSPRRTISLPPNSAQSVLFPIVPLKKRNYDVKVTAIVTNYGLAVVDAVQKELYVVNEGVEQTKTVHLCLDPLKQKEDCENDKDRVKSEWPGIASPKQVLTVNLAPPLESIPDTATATAYITSNIMDDVVSTLIGGADKLLRQPRGCGEQTMIYLAPTVYAMSYLKQTKQVNPGIEQMGNKYIRDGVARELTYRKLDGSYAAWIHRPSSTWLTAFVAKVFCQAKTIVDDAVDEAQHIVKTINWLKSKQQGDGSFVDSQPVLHREMIGQLLEKDPSLTAFVLISMSECRSRTPEIEESINKAMVYIEKLDRGMLKKNPYLLAISTYALALVKSTEKYKFNDLLKNIQHTEGSMVFWGNPGGHPANAQSIETTSYALLATMLFDDFKTAARIVRWLTSQRNAEGSFRTTQDTVMGLQALSQYSISTYSANVNLNIKFIAKKWKRASQTVVVTNDNSELQKIVKNLPINEILTVEVTGSGSARMNIDYRYNIPSKPDETCPFILSEIRTGDVINGVDPKVFPERKCDVCGNCLGDPLNDVLYDDFEGPVEAEPKANSNFGRKKREVRNRKGRSTITKRCVKFSVRAKPNEEHGMSIIHIGLETGMKVVEDDLKKLRADDLISRYETPFNKQGFITLYVDKITPVEVEYVFRLIDEFDGDKNTRATAMVKVSNYYFPEKQCSTFYRTEQNEGQSIEYECRNEKYMKECQCAQSTCATPYKKKLMAPYRRGRNLPPIFRLYKYMCNFEKADYGLRVIINSIKPNASKLINTASAVVERVYNQGKEPLRSGDEIDFYWKMNCPYPLLKTNTVYYIFAKDGNNFMGEDGEQIFKYPLMETAIVLEKPKEGEKKYSSIMAGFDKLMNRKKKCQQ